MVKLQKDEGDELDRLRIQIKNLTGRISTMEMHISYCNSDMENMKKHLLDLKAREELWILRE
jgi:ribosomal protein S15P/S13E